MRLKSKLEITVDGHDPLVLIQNNSSADFNITMNGFQSIGTAQKVNKVSCKVKI